MVATRSSLAPQQATISSSTPKGWQPYTRKRKYRNVCGICPPTKAPVVPSHVPPVRSNGNTPSRVSTSTNALELVPPPPILGSTSDCPLLIPCDEEEEQRDTKLKLNPLSRLKAAKESHDSTNGYSSSLMHEKSKKVITDEVKSMLVDQLTTSGTTTSVDDMVTLANRAFTTLNWFGTDYSSFYIDVKDLIAYKYDLLTAERKLDMLLVSELEKKYEDVVVRVDYIEEEIERTQAKQKMYLEKKEPLKRQIEDARELIRRLEREVADIEQDEKCLKDDEQKYKAAYKIAQSEVEILGTQMDAAREVQTEIEQRKNEALKRIKSITRRLMSYK